jgi:hypothetical protein
VHVRTNAKSVDRKNSTGHARIVAPLSAEIESRRRHLYLYWRQSRSVILHVKISTFCHFFTDSFSLLLYNAGISIDESLC